MPNHLLIFGYNQLGAPIVLASAWEMEGSRSGLWAHPSFVVFLIAAASSAIAFLAFHPIIEATNADSSILIAAMFAPAMIIGFLYGVKVTEGAIHAKQGHSPARRAVIKMFFIVFVMGGLFSSVSFALNNGSVETTTTILDDGLFAWASDFVHANGGVTFLIVSSITIMAAATRQIIKIGGRINLVFTFVGTFTFVMMLALSLTKGSLTDSEVYLYTFYQAGIVGGAFFEMNRLTKGQNYWQDYLNGY